MRHSVFFLFIFIVLFRNLVLVATQPKNAEPINSPFNMSFNPTFKINVDASNKNTNSDVTVVDTKNNFTATNTTQMSVAVTTLHTLQEQVKQSMFGIVTFITHNKLKTFLCVLGCSYALLVAYVYYLEKQINTFLKWAHWCEHVELEKLYEIAHKELCAQLITAVQESYFNATYPTNFIIPLVEFTKQLDAEITFLKKYITAEKIIHSYGLNRLPTIKKLNGEKAAMLLQRLLFIKNIFVSWCAEQNYARLGAV